MEIDPLITEYNSESIVRCIKASPSFNVDSPALRTF